MSIPRRLIQIGRNHRLPVAQQASAAGIRALHPDWTYEFFDDDRMLAFVGTEFPEYLEVYNGFPRNIQRVDFFRYLALFRLGGFYFDLDVFLARSLEPLLSAQAVFPCEGLTLSRHLRRQGMDWELGNYAFGAAPGQPFLAQVIKNCVRAQQDPTWLSPMLDDIPRIFRKDFVVLNSTGPGLLARTYAEHPELTQEVRILCAGDISDRAHWFLFGDFGVHMMEGSWRLNRFGVRERLERWWKIRRRAQQAGESRALGPSRPVQQRSQ
jgi:hypothetical protein